MEPPLPDPASFDAAAAAHGEVLFRGEARCVTCHTGPSFTDAGERLHAPAETGMDPAYAQRSTTGRYRTTPLRVATHPPYFHDGSAATLDDVIPHYDDVLDLDLDEGERDDIVHYLRSL